MPNLMGTEWQLVEPAPAGKAPTVAFQPGKMTGFAGCNRYVRTLDAKGKPRVATTRMLCAPPLMEMEQHFVAFLSDRFRLQPDGRAQNLVLKSEQAEYRFVRLAPDAHPATAPPICTWRRNARPAARTPATVACRCANAPTRTGGRCKAKSPVSSPGPASATTSS